MIMSICYRPERDELLYGWFLGLAKENGFDRYNPVYSFMDFYMGQTFPAKVHDGNMRKLDYMPGLEMICRRYSHMICFPEVDEIARNMTPLYSMYPFLPKGLQVKRTQFLLRERTGGVLDISSHLSDIDELKVCPDCMREDKERIGTPYFHVWHQLREVHVCAKHHRPLMRITATRGEYLGDSKVTDSMEEICLTAPKETEEKISAFLHDMYENPVNIDLGVTQTLILERMNAKGYPLKKPYGSLVEDMRDAGYDKLLNGKGDSKISFSLTQKQAAMDGNVWLLTYLFDDYDNFYAAAKKYENENEQEFVEAIDDRYELFSDYGQIVRLRCKQCGNEFYIHPYALFMGMGCPECDKALTAEQVVNRELKFLGDGKYELSAPLVVGKPARIRHFCGKERETNALGVIYEEKECACGYRVDDNEIQQRIDPTKKQFTLIKYESQRTTQKVTIRHNACGNMFRINLVNFEQTPYCRCCRPKNYSNTRFMEDMYELVGDEYEVVKPFLNQKEMVELRHRRCGTVTKGYPSEFLNGRRCELCTPQYSADILEQGIRNATDGLCKLISLKAGQAVLQFSDGTIVKKASKYVMQELCRPTPSQLFKDRTKTIEPAVSSKAELYFEIMEKCEKNGVWFIEDRKEEGKERGVIKNYLHWLAVNGYIVAKASGIYALDGEMEDSVVIEQKYVHHDGEIRGAWYGDSLAYRCGTVSEKPVVEKILLNSQKAQQWLKCKIGDTEVQTMKPPVIVTPENANLVDAVNLLEYAVTCPQCEEKVMNYLEGQNVDAEELICSDFFKMKQQQIRNRVLKMLERVRE